MRNAKDNLKRFAHKQWTAQTPMMKKVWILLAFVTAFILIHGTLTLRTNYQRAFAKAVEVKIDIKTIHVQASHGVLILTGQGTKEQSHYAEEVARFFIRNYSAQAINPPHDLRNEIATETGASITKTRKHKSKAERAVASVRQGHSTSKF